MSNPAAIEAAIDKSQEQHLKRYYVPGNLLTRNRYVDLPLPRIPGTAPPEIRRKRLPPERSSRRQGVLRWAVGGGLGHG